MKNLLSLINERTVFFDGAMGTILQENGLLPGEKPEIWNITHPDVIRQIHDSYIDAGCDIIKTNTFGASPVKFKDTEYDFASLTERGVEIARSCAEKAGRRVYVALSIGSLGKLIKPLGDLSFDEAVDNFRQIIRAGRKADFVLFETLSEAYEIKAALLAALEENILPYAVTAMLDDSGRLLSGGKAGVVYTLAESLGAFAVGLNCGVGPQKMLELVKPFVRETRLPVIVNSNAGMPREEGGKTVFDVNADEFSDGAKKLCEAGVSFVGGCCGTAPEYIEKVVAKLKDFTPVIRAVKEHTRIASQTDAINIDDMPLVIGERVNPTGKKALREAIKAGDMEYVLREALAQKDADILDINAGVPGIDEAKKLSEMVFAIQSVTTKAVQIDTGDTKAMENAIRICNGVPIINSVNGKKESMESVFPIVKKYGCPVVCLCLDENGIPDTVEGRLKIAENILNTAAEYGIKKSKLIFDALVMTISTGEYNAIITLDTLKELKKRLGVCTVLGVSNVSFGLPERSGINSAFYTMALQNGLDLGIINPLDCNMMAAYRSYLALCAKDRLGIKYIEAYSGEKVEKRTENTEYSLFEAIRQGLSEDSEKAAEKLLKSGVPCIDVIENHLVPALDEVGRGYESKTVFLPGLLMSAQAAKSAFTVIHRYMPVSETSKGKLIIATVEGDIHDIGKNIVKALLENYGFEVIDLGKDVKCEKVVEAAKENKVKLVCLSALMTTTVTNMEKTVALLKKELPDCKTLVGGAVLTPDYAKEIGANYYAKDAMESVRIATNFFTNQ